MGESGRAPSMAAPPPPPPIPSVGDEPPATAWPRSFRRRAALGGFAIAVCFVVNMLTWGGYPWFIWPTLGIGAGLALQWVLMRWR